MLSHFLTSSVAEHKKIEGEPVGGFLIFSRYGELREKKKENQNDAIWSYIFL